MTRPEQTRPEQSPLNQSPPAQSLLEQRYRFVLKVLPRSHRRLWQEEMVATFLASVAPAEPADPGVAEYEYGRPSWPEIGSVLALAIQLRLAALRLRLGGAGAPPRYATWGEAVRLAALSGLLVYAVMATWSVGESLWLARRLPLLPPPPAWAYLAPSSAWHTIMTAAGFLWIPAFLALVFGQRHAARLLTPLAVLPTAVTTVATTVEILGDRAPAYLLVRWSELLGQVLLVVALAAFHRDAPPVSRRGWLVAFGLGFVTLAGLSVVTMWWGRVSVPAWLSLDWSGLLCVVLLLTMAGYCAGLALGWSRRTASRSLALALLAAAVFTLRLASLVDYLLAGRSGLPVAFTYGAAVEMVAVALVAVVAMRVAMRDERSRHVGSPQRSASV